MVRRQLGRTGLAVAPIALGTTKLGRNTDVKYPASFALPSEQEVAALIASGLELGVNLIDTAPAYGESEQRLGAVLDTHRDQFVLCSKAGEQYVDGRSVYDFSAPAISASVELSLRRLKTDHIDILLLHSDGHDREILTETDALDTLARLKQSGKVRAVGISAKTSGGILAAVHSCDVVMAPFSQKETALTEALATAHRQGVGVLAIKGLFSGHLEARPAIEFVLNQPFIDALVIGTLNPAHLKVAVEIAENLRNIKSI
ncbi:MAG: aldo/keto reductase [Candidatus Binatia bacterium]